VGTRMPGDWRVEEREGSADHLNGGWPSVAEDPSRRAVAVCRVKAPAVVLGSTQSATVIDAARAAAQGIAVARRRSGGGAVLVTPDDPVWIDVWVPVGDRLWNPDVGRAFDWLGDTWVTALGESGVVDLAAHRGGTVPCTRWSRLVCFGGVGTGEVVTGDGRKVVGLAQRRSRGGAWFQGACVLHWQPARLVGLLALPDSERVAAEVGLGAAVAGVGDLLTGRSGRPVDGSRIARSLIAALP
jgi:lipoate---protein ligase